MLVGGIIITKPESVCQPNPVFFIDHDIGKIIGGQAAAVLINVLKVFELVTIKPAEAIFGDDP